MLTNTRTEAAEAELEETIETLSLYLHQIQMLKQERMTELLELEDLEQRCSRKLQEAIQSQQKPRENIYLSLFELFGRLLQENKKNPADLYLNLQSISLNSTQKDNHKDAHLKPFNH